MKKNLLCLLLSLVLVFSACAAVHAETVRKIGVCAGQMSDQETLAFCEMLRTFFASQETGDIKYELFFADAGGSTDTQKDQISNLLKQKLSLILINFLDSSAVEAASEALAGANTPMVLFGRQMIVRAGNEYTVHSSVDALLDRVQGCYVGGDLRQASLKQGEILAARDNHGDINGDGVIHYIILRDSAPRAESRLRTDLSLRAAGNAGLEAVCLADRSGAVDQEQAKAMFERMIQEFGNQIEAVICTHDYIAAGVVQAIQDAISAPASREPEEAEETEAEIQEDGEPEARRESSLVNLNICILGMDGTEEARQLIREGKLAGTVVIDDTAQERMAQEAILKILNKEEIQKYYWTEYEIIKARP